MKSNTEPNIGLDVHKDTIAVAVAESGRGEPLYEGNIANEPHKVFQPIEHPYEHHGDQKLLWCHETGPCGSVLFHQLTELGEECQVIAPSKTPRRPGEHSSGKRRRQGAITLTGNSRARRTSIDVGMGLPVSGA